MILSDTTNKNGILQVCEKWCGFKDGHITGNAALKRSFIDSVNEIKFTIETLILNSQDEFDYDDLNHTDFPILTTPLTTDRDYRLNASERILKLKRLDVSYDGSTYYRARPIDSAEMDFGLGNEDTVDSKFSESSPYYDIKYGSLFIYPKATTATGEMLLEWTREGVQFETDGTDDAEEPGFDRAFHSLIPKMVSYEWMAINKPNNSVSLGILKKDIGDVDTRTGNIGLLMTHYGNKQQDREHELVSSVKLNDFR